MRGWGDFGVVETIYEEENEDSFSSSSSLSPTISISSPPTPPPPHSSIVETWSNATGHKTDILVIVEGSSFHLHKDRLTCKSAYLKRQLTDASVITLSPPLNITADTFSVIADFCYGAQPVITPFNVAALITAAKLLEMTEVDGEENLRQITETCFRRIIAVNREYASIVLRSCLALLPEAETAAFLVSRCFEALSLTGIGDDVVKCFNDVKTVGVEDFQIVAESMHNRFTRSHDMLYRIIDIYIKDRKRVEPSFVLLGLLYLSLIELGLVNVKENSGKITEEQKAQLCNTIDCTKLSTQLLMHSVQNPRMPLRFIVRAMFIEQLNTRRSIIVSSGAPTPIPNHHRNRHHHHHNREEENIDPTTLGALLQRDAALRQVTQLKAAMDATCTRIQTLENDLNGMRRKLLDESEKKKNPRLLEPGKSSSFRVISSTKNNKIERGERGSVSSTSLRFSTVKGCSSSEGSSCNNDNSPRFLQKKSIGRRLMNGLKSAFRVSKNDDNGSRVSRKVDGEDWKEEEEEEDDVFVMKDEDVVVLSSHSRSLSLV